MDLLAYIEAQGLLGPAQLAQVRQRMASHREDPVSAALALKLLPERTLASFLAGVTGFPGVDLSRTMARLSLLELVDVPVMKKRQVLPLVDSYGGLVVAMAQPQDAALVSELAFTTGRKVLPHVAVPSALQAAIAQSLKLQAEGETFWRGKEMWNVQPPPEGRAAIVQADKSRAAIVPPPEEDVPVVVGQVLDASQSQPNLLDELASVLDDPLGILPPAPAAKPAAPAADAKTTERAEVGAGKVVLVVDDDAELRAMVVRLLRPLGCAVVESGNGKEALAQARELRPALVILDAMLPGLHGFEVCRAIKGEPSLRKTAVLMMSGIHTRQQVGVDVAEVHGADGFFEKPFRIDDFTRAIRRLLMVGGGGEAQVEQAARAAALAAVQEAAARWRAGKPNEAVDLLAAAAHKDPFSPEPHFYLGEIFRQTNDRYRAIASYERAAHLRPGSERVWIRLSELYEALGFRKSAVEVLSRAATVTNDPAKKAELEDRARKLAASLPSAS